MADETTRYEADNNYNGVIGAPRRDEKSSQFQTTRLDNGDGVFEMDAHTPAELDAASKRHSEGLSSIMDDTDRARFTRMVNWKHS
jgi:hypothetical protein